MLIFWLMCAAVFAITGVISFLAWAAVVTVQRARALARHFL